MKLSVLLETDDRSFEFPAIEVAEGLVGVTGGCAVVLMDDGREVARIAHAGPFSVDHLSYFVEVLGQRAHEAGLCPHPSLYTEGDCEVFAVALERLMPDGNLIAAYDPVEPGGTRKTRGAPYLIHAGLEVNGHVIDVRGIDEQLSWAQRWMENGCASDSAEWGAVDRRQLERMQKSKITEAQIADAMPLATIVSGLCGPTVVYDPEEDATLTSSSHMRMS